MKKVIISSAFILVAMVTFAQNSWYIGGLVGYSVRNEQFGNNLKSTSWSLSPEIGTAFNANWSAGFVLGMSGRSSSNDNGDLSSSFMINPDVYVRRWFNIGEHLNLFVGLDVAVGSGTTTIYGGGPNGEDEEQKSSSFNANLNTGIAYSLSERWALLFKLATLGYTSSTVEGNTSTQFGFLADGNITTGQFIFIGVYYTFWQQ